MKTFELKVETFITFTPDEDKLRETFEERHEDLCNDGLHNQAPRGVRGH